MDKDGVALRKDGFNACRVSLDGVSMDGLEIDLLGNAGGGPDGNLADFRVALFSNAEPLAAAPLLGDLPGTKPRGPVLGN